MKSSRFARAAAAAAVLAAVACGCASSRDPGASPALDDTLKPFTQMPEGSRWITPLQVSKLPAVVLAVVDFDFTGRDVAMRYCPAAFRPQESGAMNLVAFEPPLHLETVRQLGDAMARRHAGGRVALSVLANGRPLGAEGSVVPDDMLEFLRRFDEDLAVAGIDCAYLFPVAEFSLALPPEEPAP